MKCPFRKTIIHAPERKQNYAHFFANDIEEFGDCYEEECPYYQDKRCMRVKYADQSGLASET